MTIKNRLILQKEKGLSLKILIVLTIIFGGFRLFKPFQAVVYNNAPILPFIESVLLLGVLALVPLILEKQRASFSSHLLFFALFLQRYLKEIIFRTNYSDALSFIHVSVGVLASIYVLMKMYAHYEELNIYGKRVDNFLLIFLGLGVLRLYLDNSFETMMTFLFIMITIILSTKAKEVLPLIAAIFLRSIIANIFSIFYLSNAQIGVYISVVINIIVGIFILYKIVQYYIEQSKSDLNYI